MTDKTTETPTPDQARAELAQFIDEFSDEAAISLWRFLAHWRQLHTSPVRGSAHEQG